jgi:hypothetical protein
MSLIAWAFNNAVDCFAIIIVVLCVLCIYLDRRVKQLKLQLKITREVSDRLQGRSSQRPA